ncbi:MAG: dCTP deaminase [Elusimicrobia bacterium]|nr:dCTP deaminase [Elusimicrobiota bacterium]
MVKSDKWIKRMATEFNMIDPFEDKQVSKGAISYGVSSYGYDMRISNEFKVLKNGFKNVEIMDPKNFNSLPFEDFRGENCIIPPNSIVLAKSIEYFKIPRNIITICFGKSTYTRCGILVNVTPFEPEWEGFVTISISNTNPIPAKLYSNEGIAQVLFLESDEICETSYADKKGKYQAQKTITLSKI